MEIAAGQFKAQCLKLMEHVQHSREEIIITKHGKPVAKLVPLKESPSSVLGFMKDSVQIFGDITSPVEEIWEANE